MLVFGARLTGKRNWQRIAHEKRIHLSSGQLLLQYLIDFFRLAEFVGLVWEYSTRWYLSGFSNAVLPYSTTPEKKVTAILTWMEQGPARQAEYYSDDGENRDPVDTLNYKELLGVCGTATNAFVNLASAGGMEVRRLLLLDARA